MQRKDVRVAEVGCDLDFSEEPHRADCRGRLNTGVNGASKTGILMGKRGTSE